MREPDYIATIVELNPAVVPQWLEERLQRLFTEWMYEPLPENLIGLLRRLGDEEHR